MAHEIHIYTGFDACGAAKIWAHYLGGYAQEDLTQVLEGGSMSRLLSLFLTFLKINLLTASEPASVSLLYKEAVAGSRFLTEAESVSDFG